MSNMVIPILLLGASISLTAQTLTLPELARRFAPEPVIQVRMIELVIESLDYLLPKAALVIQGVVSSATTHLSSDEKHLYTEYSVRPIRIIRQRSPTPNTRAGQGRPQIQFTMWGGQMTIEGVQVTQQDGDLRTPQIGDEVVLLLEPRQGGKHGLSSLSGAFYVVGSQLKPWIHDAPVFEDSRGMSVAEFVLQVQRQDR
jgi:hypothetical protein